MKHDNASSNYRIETEFLIDVENLHNEYIDFLTGGVHG